MDDSNSTRTMTQTTIIVLTIEKIRTVMGAITMGCETEQEQKFFLSTLTKDQFCMHLQFSNGQT